MLKGKCDKVKKSVEGVELLPLEVRKIIKKLVNANRTTERICELLTQKGYMHSNNSNEILSEISMMKFQKLKLGKFLFVLGIVLIIASFFAVGIGLSNHNPRTPYIDVIIAAYIIYIGNKLKRVSE